jgi:8-oxo-dGTP pyrophosphatase MutT (NUDIX family)
MLVESAAGLLDEEDAETAIRREASEELGVAAGEVEHVFDVYMSPDSVTRNAYTPSPRPTRPRRGYTSTANADGEVLGVSVADRRTVWPRL